MNDRLYYIYIRYNLLRYAELVDTTVCVSLTRAEECRWPLRLVW